MQSNFDFIAPFYDSLAGLVFGKALQKAKTSFTDRIPDDGQLLLMGGGTGSILNTLLNTHPALEIDFVDVSGKMLSLAKEKLYSGFQHRVTFIHGDHHAIPAGKTYDAATSFFVIDCMKQLEATEFTSRVVSSLKTDGLFLFADFFEGKSLYYRALLSIMYRFFRLTAGISAGKLPDYDKIFSQLPLREIDHRSFLNGFIHSKIYQRI